MNEVLFFNTPSIHIRFVANFAFEKISELLQAKGMNPDVALVRAQEVFGNEHERASLYLHNFQRFFDTTIMQRVYEYIAKKALFQESILFGSYDQILGMMQQVYRSALNEEELKQLRQISQANHFGIALVH